MKRKLKVTLVFMTLLAILLIQPLYLKLVNAQTITGTQDDTLGVWLYSAGTTIPAGAPTDDIIEKAIFYDLLDYIGDAAEEVYDFGWGPNEPTPGQEDTTLAEVIQGLSAVDDFGNIANAGDDPANFDTGRSGYFEGGFDPLTKMVIRQDGISSNGTLGPNGALTKEEAEAALNGCEIFIFEDAELSGMNVTLSNTLGLSITFSLTDLQVNPPTPSGADDTLIAIDLDTLAGFDGSFIDTIRIQDDGLTSPSTYGDTTLEIDAIAIKRTECPVTFFTDPDTIGNITFDSVTYIHGDSDVFPYGTSGEAYADAPVGWAFSHWITMGNVEVSNTTDNPTTFTILCGGNLTAVFVPIECTLVFYTDPMTVGNITFESVIYLYGENGTFPYGLVANATANAPVGWIFSHWIAEGNVQLSSTTDNPTEVTIVCGGNLTAVFTEAECLVIFFTIPPTADSIMFKGVIYTHGQSGIFPYGTSGEAYAIAPEGWVFDHWETVGNIKVSNTTANPTTFTILCGGNLTAVFVPIECTLVFYTDPMTVGNITFESVIYLYGENGTFPYGLVANATANAPVGWIFSHWIAEGNVQLSSTTDNPTEVTIVCGGNLTAVFTQVMCPVIYFTDPADIGNITFLDVTYLNGEDATYAYGTSGLAYANAPEGWAFSHWITVGNIEVSSTTENPTTFTILCGGNLTAVFVQEGTGDFGTIGYWKHVFYVWKSGRGTFKDYVEAILMNYLARINAASTVFSENYTLTMESAYDLLWSRDQSMYTRALKQCLASWLNWADGATTMSQMVDTNYDKVPDMPFGDAMTLVEDILRDPNSTWHDLEYAKNICDSINNM